MNYFKPRNVLLIMLFTSLLISSEDFKVTGKLHNVWVDYDYNNDPKSSNNANLSQGNLDSKGYYFSPKLSIISPTWKKISFKATVAGVTDLGINDKEYESGTLADNGKSYAILQESYIKYEDKNHFFLIGREEFDSPMINNDDYYILADTFELAYYKNKSIENMTFSLGYVYKMAGMWDSGASNTSKGGTEFYSMSEASYVAQEDKDNAGDKGVAFISYEYDNEKHKLQLWDYYAFELYNTFFSQYNYLYSYKNISYDLGFQFIDYSEVGDLKSNNYTEIDYYIYAVNIDAKLENGMNFSTAFSRISDGDGSNATLGAWGAFPQFTFGLIHSWWNIGSFQNSKNYKLNAGYDFKSISGLSINTQYLYVDLDPSYSKTAGNIGQDYKISYGAIVNYEMENGLYSSLTYEFSKIDKDEDIDALFVFAGYKF